MVLYRIILYWQPTRTACHPFGYLSVMNALPPPLAVADCRCFVLSL